MVFLWFSYGLPYPNDGCYCQMPWPWPSPRHVVNHDERSGGFYALGWAKGINEVVADASAVVCYENHRKTIGKPQENGGLKTFYGGLMGFNMGFTLW